MSARDPVPLPPLPSDSLLDARGVRAPAAGLVVGRLVGFANEGRTPLVAVVDASDGPALPAQSAVDLHGAHVGRRVVMGHEGGDLRRPIVLGVLGGDEGWPLRESVGNVEVSADGERMTVSARHQLVLRCGESSIVLRSDGRVEIRGETVITQAVGANHVRGGSVQLN
jgi:hypothetical protein